MFVNHNLILIRLDFYVINRYYNIIGLMSGSSYDGIDVSLVKTNGQQLIRTGINHKHTYKDETIALIKKFLTNPLYFAQRKKLVKKINYQITMDHLLAVNQIIDKNKIKPDFIGFHGQTVYHNYKKKKPFN